jgi:hypothetical protein
VLPDPAAFIRSVELADAHGASALHYPQRWLYAGTRRGRFVEASTRWFRVAAGFPGPAAVRAGTNLVFCRETAETRRLTDTNGVFRVDVRRKNTDTHRGPEWPVHALVRSDQAILHFARVRQRSAMVLRSRYHGHAAAIDWDAFFSEWDLAHRHPRWFCARYLVRPGPLHFRTTRLPYDPAIEADIRVGHRITRRRAAKTPVLLDRGNLTALTRALQ